MTNRISVQSDNVKRNNIVAEASSGPFQTGTVPHNSTDQLQSDDVAALRAVLLTKQASERVWTQIVHELLGYFGPEREVDARDLFIEWVQNCRPADELGPHPRDELTSGQLVDMWQSARDEAAELWGAQARAALTETLQALKINYSPRIEWPDLDKKSLKPLGHSQTNIRHFLGAIGVTVWKDLHSLRYLIDGFKDFTELNDEAMRALWLQADSLGLVTRQKFFESVVLNIARENGKHPLREYLDAIERKWDGRPRIGTWLSDYLGAPHTALNQAFGSLFLKAAIRRVRRPGVKFDFLLTLEGRQGLGKSSVGRVLAGVNYFEDGLELGAATKNVVEQTGGKWIIEASELGGMGRRETEAVKAMLSRTHDTARLAYDKTASTVPRQFVMIGTTNETTYLRDPTGGRRFWTVSVGEVDLAKLRADREQLLAEAAHLESEATRREIEKGDDPDAFLALPRPLWEIAGEEQEKRVVADPLEECLRSALTTADGDLRAGTIELEYLYEIAGASSDDRKNQGFRTRLGNVMTRLGYQYDRPFKDGKQLKVYKRADENGNDSEILTYKADMLLGRAERSVMSGNARGRQPEKV